MKSPFLFKWPILRAAAFNRKASGEIVMQIERNSSLDATAASPAKRLLRRETNCTESSVPIDKGHPFLMTMQITRHIHLIPVPFVLPTISHSSLRYYWEKKEKERGTSRHNWIELINTEGLRKLLNGPKEQRKLRVSKGKFHLCPTSWIPGERINGRFSSPSTSQWDWVCGNQGMKGGIM